VGEYQHIVYRHFLPRLLGRDVMTRHGVVVAEAADSSTYSDRENPSIKNEFSTAAFRYGHSAVQSVFRGLSQPWLLSNGLGDASFATRNDGTGYANEIGGACDQPQSQIDRWVTSELTGSLFANHKMLGAEIADRFASDLIATNIQRGRDHGVPNYNAVRSLVGLSPIRDMEASSRPAEISEDNWSLLARLFRSPNEIDLYTAGLAESRAEGSMLGPTFSWMVAEQFRALKDGDRFFFTHSNARGLPRPIQEMVTKRTLGDLFCDNVKDMAEAQLDVFLVPANDNPKVGCDHPGRAKIDFDVTVASILEEEKRGARGRQQQFHYYERQPRHGDYGYPLPPPYYSRQPYSSSSAAAAAMSPEAALVFSKQMSEIDTAFGRGSPYKPGDNDAPDEDSIILHTSSMFHKPRRGERENDGEDDDDEKAVM